MSNGHDRDSAMATTWHHGLIARWWANFTAGCEPVLYVQPTHRLDVPRRYRTIINCGAFGLGGSRADDTEGLRRLRAHLLPGGVLALDYEVYEFDDDRWRRWRPRPADETPPPSQARRLGLDGFYYAVRQRIAAIDVAERSMTRELQAWQWQHGELVAHETLAAQSSSRCIATQAAHPIIAGRLMPDRGLFCGRSRPLGGLGAAERESSP